LLLIAVGFAAKLILVLSAHLAGIQIPRALLQVFLVLVAGCYFVPQWRAGQTLPMKTWRIRLVGLAGEPLPARQSLLRYALAVLSWLLLGGGYLWALADRDAQFLHDRLAHTRLVALPR
jgi:uncharacterized RDD family membrane protein YckC